MWAAFMMPDGRGKPLEAFEKAAACGVDVRHNFVQRWNEASERHAEVNNWGSPAASELPFLQEVMPERGQALVQIQRTIHADLYQDGHAPSRVKRSTSPQASVRTLRSKQYGLAIRSAQRAIYLENQYLDVPDIVQALHETLERGVKVVALVPGVPVLMARETTSEGHAFFETRATLGDAVYNI